MCGSFSENHDYFGFVPWGPNHHGFELILNIFSVLVSKVLH